jgi:hypothetical protein
LSDAELDTLDDRGFELALGLFLDGLIHRGPASSAARYDLPR